MSCEICDGRTWVDRGDGAMVRCSCFDPRPGIWARAEVPTKHRVPFEDLATWPTDPRPGSIDLRKWRGEPWCVVVSGPVGPGKTKLGVELLDRLVLCGAVPSWRFIAASAVPDICVAGGEAWRALCSAPAMLIDDLGRNYKGDQAMFVHRLIAWRWDWSLPTVLPTNLEFDGPGMNDQSMLDRLSEGLNVKLDGPSRRRRA